MTAVLAALALSSPAVADAPPRPELGAPEAYAPPAVESVVLENGLEIVLIPFGNVPKLSIVTEIEAGTLDMPAARGLIGLAGALMNEGADGSDAAAIARRAADIGGSVGAGGGRETFSVSVSSLSDHAPEAIDLMADVLLRPNLPGGELPRLKTDVKRNLSIERTTPQSLAGEALSSALYPEHPFGLPIPTDAEIDAISLDAIKQFRDQALAPNRARIYVAGQFERDEVVSELRRQFGSWKPGPEPVIDVPEKTLAPTVILVDRPDAPQSTIYLAYDAPPADSDDAVPFTVMDEILGGGFSSRITTNLREDKGYTYSPSSAVTRVRGEGAWRQTADVTTANTGDALREIFYEIDRLKAATPPADELERAQNSLAGSWTLSTASRGGLIGQLSYYDFHGLPRSRMAEFVPRIRAVTPAEISAMARQYLTPENMILVVVGDLETVRPQLEQVPQLKGLLPPTS